MTADVVRVTVAVLALLVMATSAWCAVQRTTRSQGWRFAVVVAGYALVTALGQVDAIHSGRPVTWLTWLLAAVNVAALAGNLLFVVETWPGPRGRGGPERVDRGVRRVGGPDDCDGWAGRDPSAGGEGDAA